MNRKNLESYLRVNLLGPGPRPIKKNLPGRGLTKFEKHCSIGWRTPTPSCEEIQLQKWTDTRPLLLRVLIYCRGIPPPLNSGLMTALSQSGQFSALSASLPSFTNKTGSRYPVSSRVKKLWITIMQLRKTFPSFGRKLKDTWLYLTSAALHCLPFYYW
jgi:hypothetical protein